MLFPTTVLLKLYILLTKRAAAQNESALSYHRMRGLHFLAVVFVGTTITIVVILCFVEVLLRNSLIFILNVTFHRISLIFTHSVAYLRDDLNINKGL